MQQSVSVDQCLLYIETFSCGLISFINEMELRQLRYFLAVANERHFGKAARKLHITQPPLSIQIRNLENELGVALFTRNTRTVALTDAGRVFLTRVESIMDAIEVGVQDTRNAGSGLSGRLEVGLISSATLSVIPTALQAFGSQFPGVNLVLKEISSGRQIDALYNEEIRVGVARLPVYAKGLMIEKLHKESMVVALPQHHRLTARPELDMDAIAHEPFIFFHRQDMPGFYDHVLGLFRAQDKTPRISQYALHLETIIGLVAGEAGLSILPSSCCRLHRDGVVYRPLVCENSETWLGVIHLKDDQSLILENFKKALKRSAEILQTHIYK